MINVTLNASHDDLLLKQLGVLNTLWALMILSAISAYKIPNELIGSIKS